MFKSNQGYAIRVDESDNDIIRTKSGLIIHTDSSYGAKEENHKQTGILVSHKEGYPRIPTGVQVWFHHFCISTKQVFDGETLYFADKGQILAYEQDGELKAAPDKTLCRYIPEEIKTESGLYLKAVAGNEKGVGIVVHSDIYPAGETILHWGTGYPFVVHDSEQFFVIDNEYVIKSETKENPNYVLVEPLDEDDRWMDNGRGIYIPNNKKVPVGLARVVKKRGVFNKGDKVLHDKKAFNKVPRMGNIHAVKISAVHGKFVND